MWQRIKNFQKTAEGYGNPLEYAQEMASRRIVKRLERGHEHSIITMGDMNAVRATNERGRKPHKPGKMERRELYGKHRT